MRAPPPRTASAQVVTQPPSSVITTQRYGPTMAAAADPSWLLHYQDWQAWARRYTRQIGTASFAAGVSADCAARTILQVEERTGEDWRPSDNPLFAGIFDAYANSLQLTPELVRLHSWHYSVAGECLQVQRDGAGGAIDYSIHSTASAVWDQPYPGQVTIKLVPDGKVDAGTAFVVPRDQVIRFWIPDQEWQAFAWSPMASSIDDLHRWRAMARYAWRTADSQLAMNGMLWTPTAAHTQPPPEADMPDDLDVGAPRSLLQEQYMEAARMRFTDLDDIAAIAPFMVHWDKDDGLPQWFDMGKGLDAQGIAHRKEALEDFARATSLPNTMVMGGGVGDANHWSEWLATDKFYSSAIAPTMERICYTDLTRTFLWPRLTQIAGWTPAQLATVRVGFDPAPVIVKPDKSQMALEALKMGAISYESAREAMGFDETDAATDADIRTLIEVTRSRVQEQATLPPASPGSPALPSPSLPSGPGNVRQAPPGNGRGQPPPPELQNVATGASVASVAALLAAVLAEDADAYAD